MVNVPRKAGKTFRDDFGVLRSGNHLQVVQTHCPTLQSPRHVVLDYRERWQQQGVREPSQEITGLDIS